MSRHPVPDAALAEAGAILGRTGSGKTQVAQGLAARVLGAQERLVAVDPTGVWWGLRSSADGATPAFAVMVFGGQHADVPITEASAIPLAVTLATQNLPAIVDVSEFTHAARTRFMTAFLDTLYHENRAPLTLFLDEADLFAPQRPMPGQEVMFSRVEQIVRRGRVRGFRPWLITQRPAELHKSVLSQASTLVMMRMMASQDRKAVGAWIEGQADRDEGKKVLAQLPRLKIGEGYVWSPSHDVFGRFQFPRIATFDSSRTPEAGEPMPRVALAQVDKSRISEELRQLEDEVAHDDPDKLRARISELQAQLEAAKAGTIIDADRYAAAAKATGHREGFEAAVAFVLPHVNGLREDAMKVVEQAQRVQMQIEAARAKNNTTIAAADNFTPAVAKVRVEPVTAVEGGARARGGNLSMPKAERAILTAAAQVGGQVSRARLSLISGYSKTSSSFANAITALRGIGYVEGKGDAIAATVKGVAALGSFQPLPTGGAMRHYWINRVPRAESTLLAHLIQSYPNLVSRARLSAATGYSETSSSFANALTTLRGLGLITGGRGADLRAADELFQ